MNGDKAEKVAGGIKVVESATNLDELKTVSNKYGIVFIPNQPIMLLSRVAEILYEQDGDIKYAVCDSDGRIEVVEYGDEKELTEYCRKNGFNFLSTIDKDGSGMVISLPEPEEKVAMDEKGEEEVAGKVHINREKRSRFGEDRDEVYVNFGEVEGMSVNFVSKGIHINYGEVDFMGHRASGGTFVTKTQPKISFAGRLEGPTQAISPRELHLDKILSDLMAEVEKASGANDIPKVEELAREIEEHVRTRYKPRVPREDQ